MSTRQIVPYIPDEETPDIEGLTIKRVEGIRFNFVHFNSKLINTHPGNIFITVSMRVSSTGLIIN